MQRKLAPRTASKDEVDASTSATLGATCDSDAYPVTHRLITQVRQGSKSDSFGFKSSFSIMALSYF